MSSDGSDAPTMSIAERIAALNKKVDDGDGAPPVPVVTKPKSTNALADRIAALQKSSDEPTTGADNEGESKSDKPKVGKLKKPPAGAIPIMFGAGPPPSLMKKQKEREERMERLQQEAQETSEDVDGGEEKPKVGKLKLPTGATPIMPFGAGPPPSLLKKQREREERMEKMKQEAQSTEDGEGGESDDKQTTNEDALLERPTIKGKRRPRTRS